MKRLLVSVLFASVVVFLFSTVYAAEAIKLKFANYFPPTHKNSLIGAQFCDEIKKRTSGKVEITYYPGGTLSSAPKMFNGVVQGITDIGMSTIAYNKGRFPLTEAHDLPLDLPSGYVSTHVANDAFKKYRPKEWDAVHVLYFFATGPNIVHSLKKQVRTLEDMRGLKLRAVGRTADVVTALGATPMPIEMVDLYESLRRGVLDGAMTTAEVLKGFKTGELVKSATSPSRIGSTFVFYLVMNKEKWNSLPDQLKKAFDDVSEELKERHAVIMNEIDIEGIDCLKQNGGQMITLSDAESKRWEKAVEPVIAGFKTDLVSKGFNQAEVDEYIGYLKERATFWKRMEKEKNIPTAFQ